MVQRRGPNWWRQAIRAGTRLIVLDFADTIAGYASYGRNRMPALGYGGEIFELYLMPEYQGVGLGRRMFAGRAQPILRRMASPPSSSGRSAATSGRSSSTNVGAARSCAARANGSARRRASASRSASNERATNIEALRT